jgi:transposase
MRNQGSPEELEYRRFLAIRRILEGYSTEEVAEFLDVDPRSVRRWFSCFRRSGAEGLRAGPISGRPPKLSTTQEKIVLRWLSENPTEHGFGTELWTGPRLARLIQQEFGIRLNPRYLCAWLRDRGFTPQKPQRVPRQRDPEAIAAWLRTEWPRIKKRPDARGPILP